MGTSPSPGGRRLATLGDDGTTRLWDTATWGLRRVLTGQGGPVKTAQLRHDGRQLLSRGEDGVLCICDVDSCCLLARLVWPGRVLIEAAFTADGQHILVRSTDGSQYLFDVRPASRSIPDLQTTITTGAQSLLPTIASPE